MVTKGKLFVFLSLFYGQFVLVSLGRNRYSSREIILVKKMNTVRFSIVDIIYMQDKNHLLFYHYGLGGNFFGWSERNDSVPDPCYILDPDPARN